MKRKLLTGIVLLALGQGLFAQKVVENYAAQQGVVRYGTGENDLAAFGPKGYTLVLPDDGRPVSGTVVDLEDVRAAAGDTLTYAAFKRASLQKGFAFLTIATGKPMDWYFDQSSLRFVDTVMQDSFTRYNLPNKNVFLLGLMTSGHRALKYVEYCKNGNAAFVPSLRGVILSECAIDWVRMWYESQKQIRDHETASSAFEGNLVHYLFDQHFHATPAADIDQYIEFSPYSYSDLDMKKQAIFSDLSIRAYTYADTRYWFAAKGKGIYDSNYPDMSGFINEQKLAGNKKAELIVFSSGTGEPVGERMRRQSATWDLVDKQELVEWMVGQGEPALLPALEPAADVDPRSGDIIFQTSRSAQSEAIQQATHSKYSHCGIINEVDGKLFVFEAVEPVKSTPLQEWIARGQGGHYVIKRLKNADRVLTPTVLKKFYDAEKGFAGKHYDIFFEWSDASIYCSELIWKVYFASTGLAVGKLEKLKDFDLSSPAVKKIMSRRYGSHIPYEESVISPVSIFNSDLLTTVDSH